MKLLKLYRKNNGKSKEKNEKILKISKRVTIIFPEKYKTKGLYNKEKIGDIKKTDEVGLK
tara:strand:- start:563 stop:742 length:180 start_codon:yes stop_codon:yes gene_type:complete